MDDFVRHEMLKDAIGITIFVFFIAGIAMAVYGFRLKCKGDIIRGKKLIAAGVFMAFFAFVASSLENVF